MGRSSPWGRSRHGRQSRRRFPVSGEGGARGTAVSCLWAGGMARGNRTEPPLPAAALLLAPGTAPGERSAGTQASASASHRAAPGSQARSVHLCAVWPPRGPPGPAPHTSPGQGGRQPPPPKSTLQREGKGRLLGGRGWCEAASKIPSKPTFSDEFLTHVGTQT